MEREVRYCTTDDGVRIAYCVEGEGATTILAPPTFNETFSLDHLMPVYQQFYRDLGAGRRVIRFDWRGTGLSADMPDGALVEQYPFSDMEAVARAAGQPCVVWATTSAGSSAIQLAVAHPELVSHMILYGTYAATGDALSQDFRDAVVALALADWQMAAQTIADINGRREFPDEAAQLGDWYYRSESVESFLARRTRPSVDASALLSRVQAPTLILHRIADPAFPLSASQKLAAGIPGARFVTLEGKGHLFCLGDYSKILSAIDAFLGDRAASVQSAAAPASTPAATGMAVILFTDIVDSTALTERLGDTAFRTASRALDEAMRAAMREAGGIAVEGKVLGDGVMGVFTSASEAIVAARRCVELSAGMELPLHIGLHAGDVIHEKDNVYGGAVNIASRICGLCAPGEILVSATVRDLARTSAAVTFEDRGEQALKGIEDAVRLYEVRWRP